MKNYIYTLLLAAFIAAPIQSMEKRPADSELIQESSKKARAEVINFQPTYVEILPADIKNMLSEHINANKVLTNGLAHASESGDITNIQYMLKHFPQLKVDEQDCQGYTPLIRATMAGHTNIAALLLKSGASPYSSTRTGGRPLWYCAHHNRPGIAQLVLEKIYETPAHERVAGENVSALGGGNCQTPLGEAVILNHPAMVAVLLDSGFDPNAKIDTGSWQIKNNSCLIHAAQNGYTEIIDLLINAGAQVNFKNATVTQRFTNDIQAHKADMTALMYAADHGHAEAVARLLKAPRINVNAKNAEDKTALDLAIASTSHSKNKIIKLLQKHMNKKQ